METNGKGLRQTTDLQRLNRTEQKRNGSRHPAIHIGVLAYADDICLLVESIDDVVCSLHRHESIAAEIGLAINHNKTNFMHLGQASVRYVRFANGDHVDSSDKFEYLGVPISNIETAFRPRLSKACAVRPNSTQSSTDKRMTLLRLLSADQL